jgi:hypothetical protein
MTVVLLGAAAPVTAIAAARCAVGQAAPPVERGVSLLAAVPDGAVVGLSLARRVGRSGAGGSGWAGPWSAA